MHACARVCGAHRASPPHPSLHPPTCDRHRHVPPSLPTSPCRPAGNSGGPLLDSGGCLIGINTAIYSPSGANSGVGFAIPVDVVNSSVQQIIEHGRVVRPVLGAFCRLCGVSLAPAVCWTGAAWCVLMCWTAVHVAGRIWLLWGVSWVDCVCVPKANARYCLWRQGVCGEGWLTYGVMPVPLAERTRHPSPSLHK